MRRIITSLLLLSLVACVSISDVEQDKIIEVLESDKWISEVIAYAPAPGQFINGGMGNQIAASKLVGGKSVVSLGGFGGSIVFRFKYEVANGVGDDFVVFGNSYPDTINPENSNSEPGIVQVSYDENGNGKADDKWYELRGANHAEEGVIKNYEITYKRPAVLTDMVNVEWVDNQGKTGVIDVSAVLAFHKTSIYPLAEFFEDGQVPESVTFKGTLLLPNGERAEGELEHWTLSALGNGYVDNYSSDYVTVVGGDDDTKDSNKFDIANAIDENGDSVNLPKITFIKVYSAVSQSCGWLGEVSTEVCGAISLHAPKGGF